MPACKELVWRIRELQTGVSSSIFPSLLTQAYGTPKTKYSDLLHDLNLELGHNPFL